MKTFFLVWNPNGSNPQIRHDYEAQARTEAERLAKLHPMEQFYVLEVKSLSRAVTVQTIRLSPAGLPSPETDDDNNEDPFGDE